jgi:hypothetical protein
MRGLLLLPLFLVALALIGSPTPADTDRDIKQILIRESIASYPGNCPCPYNTDRAGRSCGKRSAYRRPGGRVPLCYESDITQAMVDSYRARKKQ